MKRRTFPEPSAWFLVTVPGSIFSLAPRWGTWDLASSFLSPSPLWSPILLKSPRPCPFLHHVLEGPSESLGWGRWPCFVTPSTLRAVLGLVPDAAGVIFMKHKPGRVFLLKATLWFFFKIYLFGCLGLRRAHGPLTCFLGFFIAVR